jgi:uncharacterized membrane protein
VLAGSQLLIQPPAGVRWTGGETLIALATGMWAIEVIVAKRVLRGVPAPVAAAARMGIGLIVLVGYLAASGGLAGLAALTVTQWAWVAGTGVLLAGYVGTWYAALRRAPAIAVTAVLTLGAPITAVVQLPRTARCPCRWRSPATPARCSRARSSPGPCCGARSADRRTSGLGG